MIKFLKKIFLVDKVTFTTVKSDLQKQIEKLDKDPSDIKASDLNKFKEICVLYEKNDKNSYSEIKTLCKKIEEIEI